MASKNQGWKLRYWIALGYCLPIGLSIISGFFVSANVFTVKQEAESLMVGVDIQEKMTDLALGVQTISRATRGYLLDGNATSKENVQDALKEIDTLYGEIEPEIRDEGQKATFEEMKKAIAELEAINNNLIAIVDSGDLKGAVEEWKKDGGREASNSVTELIKQFRDRENEIIAENSKVQEDGINFLFNTVWGATGTSVVVATLFAWWLINKITRQINETANDIATSSHEIAATIEQQDRTASQQAASVNETTTTVDELNASSRQSTEQADAAANAAREALQLAENGDQAVQQTLRGMNDLKVKVGAISEQIMRLSEQTNQIGNISALVSDIANRTNMLALNAAVEAVRAGEHGKGFAVVAAEIRKLADQSKQSAGKINTLVSQIQNSINTTVMVTDEGTKTVDSGMQVAQNTAMAFAGVRESVNNVVMNNQQISLNIRQQSTAFQQVLDAMNSINQGARETSAGITQSRIGTQKLTEVTEFLKELV
jgi:methyl-accepting chemotaxis protein